MAHEAHHADANCCASCRKLRRAATRDALVRQLAEFVAMLRAEPASSQRDDRLFDILLTLYDRSPEEVWDEVIKPWIHARDSKLRLVYAEHRALPCDTHLLDAPHAPMLLEGLEQDRVV